MATDGVLSGLRVLDFGRYIAGPQCAAMLGDLGAEVIRVERPAGAEDRALIPLSDRADDGALFLQMNRNKRGMTLNARTPAGREVLGRLVQSADVVVANLPDPALRQLGLDYGSLAQIRPDIVLTTVTAFGEEGPWSDRPGFDGVGQVMSGAAYLSGSGEEPTKSYVLWVDLATAAFCAFATLAALREREQSGRGQHVRGSLLGTALAAANSTLMEEAVLGTGRVRSGNRAQVAGPADIYATLDGWIIVQVVGDAMFRRWAGLVGHPELADDSRFSTDQLRGDHRDELAEIMQPWSAAQTSDEALDALAAAGIPSGPVLSPAQALTHPQVLAGQWLAPIDRDAGITPPVIGLPVTMPHGKRTTAWRAPKLGEHTNQILGELGYEPAAIAQFREKGAI